MALGRRPEEPGPAKRRTSHGICAPAYGGVRRRETGSDFRWYVDPLDGTTNFAHGFPVFCVSLGLEHRGELIAGVIYDPTRDELFGAEKGSGAFLNGGRMQVSKTKRLSTRSLSGE